MDRVLDSNSSRGALMHAARILVVDDEPDLEPLIRQRFRNRIRNGELEFLFARDGAEALATVEQEPRIDVVLSDINMPVMDGLTLLSRLGALDRLLKTVIVSAYDDMQNIRAAMNRGAFDFLTKPIDFHDFETTLNKTLAELALIREAEHHRDQLFALQNEISIASRIQQGILPRDFPAAPPVEIFARMLPARVVSGDFYDFFPLDENRMAFAIGDVSGKGVPAALYMAVARTLLRATAVQKLAPVDCLLYINHVLARQSEGEMFLTLLYGVLDLLTGDVHLCVAGHQPPWLLTGDKSPEPLGNIRGAMLGLFDDPEIGEANVRLQPGSALLLTTDGVIDAENPDGNEFGSSRLGDTLASAATQTAQKLVDDLFRSLVGFVAGAPHSDDITALCVRYLPAPADRS